MGNKVAGLHFSHDCSFVVLDNGHPEIHLELERVLRIKEPAGDALKLLSENYDVSKINHFSHGYEPKQWTIQKHHPYAYAAMQKMAKENGTTVENIGHHQCHAANAFYSSNFDDALIVTIDGGGWDVMPDHEGTLFDAALTMTIWKGNNKEIVPLKFFGDRDFNIGVVWNECTKQIFGLSGGYPKGNQCGSVMAMAAMGNANKYYGEFWTNNFVHHPNKKIDYEKFKKIAANSEEDSFHVAAALQLSTENFVRAILQKYITSEKPKNICFSGGVALNSVMMGKLLNWYESVENVYVCPVPYDGGLCIGAAQYTWHSVLKQDRIKWIDNCTPYLGKTYSEDEVTSALAKYEDVGLVKKRVATPSDVAVLLSENDNVISVFAGGSESGRRALGNRSILADPRNPQMKDIINQKVKHRQWYRPFAPSILREKVKDWFTNDIQSPYMSFVLDFKEEMKSKVPAVVHLNGTARLQTVTENDNSWYYNFIKEWEKVSGVPIVLNTSFNDREPIVETPTHALNCFLKTKIDYLYFADYGLLVEKNK
jgi:carbamoyltransferase